jgi:N-acetylglucosamine kinase-like BadF-type ATPase
MFHVLGIDAGGTKTVCLLADQDGAVIAEARRSGANLQASGELQVEKVLHEVMEEALGDRGIVPTAIRAVLRESDKRGRETSLTGMLLKHFGVPQAQGLIHEVYNTQLKPAAIGALAKCVQSAFSEGDEVAIGILRAAADELEGAALSVARRLDLIGEAFPFILAGGIFRAVPWLEQELERRLPIASPRSRVELLQREPAMGAVALALQEARGHAAVPAYKLE